MTLQTVILAGGLGTRMRPATEVVPKALLPVAGRPFVAWQLDLLTKSHITDVVFAVGHLGEQIEDFVGDGSRWHLSVRYSYEEQGLMGTAGALRLAADRGLLDGCFFVLYGDSYLPIPLLPVEQSFRASSKPALMTVLRNDGRLEPSNAIFDGCAVTLYDKRVGVRSTGMRFIDYGLSVLSRTTVVEHVDRGAVHDLADVMSTLSVRGDLAGYEVHTRFFEVGSPQGIKDLEGYLGETLAEANDLLEEKAVDR